MPVPDSSEYTRKIRLLAESVTEPQDFAKQLYHSRVTGIGLFNFLPSQYDLPPPTLYSISANITTVDEGSSVVFTITTTNVGNGTTLYWTTSGTAVAADFTDNTSSGSFTITSNTGIVTRTINSDITTEGVETFALSIRNGSISGPIVAISPTITILDTSKPFAWATQTGAPSAGYYGVRVTSDFTRIIMNRNTVVDNLEGPYISTDSGATFTRRVTGMTFAADEFTADTTLARSAGLIMYAANRGTSTQGPIYKSTDGGLNWSIVSPANALWFAIACSADAQIVVAVNSNSADATYSQRIVYSTNGGSTWSAATGYSSYYPGGIDISADGTKMFVVSNGVASAGNPIRYSGDSGATWSSLTNSFRFTRVRCSDDGQTIIAGRVTTTGSTTFPYLSTNGGATWSDVTAVGARQYWIDCAISGDGQTIAVSPGISGGSGTIWVSYDRGATWVEQTDAGSRVWISMGISSDGKKIFGGSGSGTPWVGTR